MALFDCQLLTLGQSFIGRNGELLQMIKRVRWATLVALATTTTIGLLSLAPGVAKYFVLVRIVLLHYDIFISLLSVIISFRGWRARCGSTLDGKN